MSDHDDFGAFLIGFVVGGVAGAVAALLLAPQSGEETRALIKDKSIELRDKAAEQAELVATKANEFADDAKSRGKEAIESVKKTVARKRPAASTGE
ncbi:MAG: YtxH domain-containing protein [Chloroflexi bacterium]|nr:YtxH domain-containing protein [Chloroflexota bacterium]